MKRRVVAGVALVAGLLLIGYALFGRRTDEEKIMAVLEHLRRVIHLDEPQGNPILRQAHLEKEYATIFGANLTYDFPEVATEAAWRRGVAALTVRGSLSFDTLDVDFTRTQIEMQASGGSAAVSTRAVLNGTRGGRPEHQERKVTFDFAKPDGDWLIGHFRVWPEGADTVAAD